MNTIETPLIRAWREPFWGKIALLVKREDTTGVYHGEPVRMVKIEDDTITARPTLGLSMQQAQVLMDDLWNCGIRPTEGAGSAGQLAATQTHLEDMQTIAFKLLEELTKPAPPMETRLTER